MAGTSLSNAASRGNLPPVDEAIQSLRSAARYIRDCDLFPELSAADREATGRLILLEIQQVELELRLRAGQCARCGRLEVYHG